MMSVSSRSVTVSGIDISAEKGNPISACVVVWNGVIDLGTGSILAKVKPRGLPAIRRVFTAGVSKCVSIVQPRSMLTCMRGGL